MKKVLTLLLILLVGCQSNSEMPRQAGKASTELMKGLEAMHHVRFSEARSHFEEGILKDSNCVSCYLNLGNAEQDRVLRREYFEKALIMSKKGHPETKIIENTVNWINGEADRFEVFPELYKKYNNDKFLASGAYRYYQSKDKIDEGRLLLQEASQRLNAGHLYNLLAYSYIWNAQNEEEYNAALPLIEKYIQINPNEANAYDSLGEFYLNKGDFDTAIDNYELAAEVDPNFEWASRNLSLAKYQKKLSNESVELMPRSTDSDNAKIFFNTGMWQLYNLEWKLAEESFSSAISEDNSFALAYAMRARTHFFQEQQDSMKEDLDIAVSMSLNASNEEQKMIIALSNDLSDGTNTFNRVIERLVKKYPDSSYLRFETIFATINDIGPDAVLRRGKELYAMNPDFTPALNIMGYAHLQKAELDNAKDLFQEQVRRQPGKANPYDSLGDFYLEVKDDEMALKYFKQSAKMGLEASQVKVDSLIVVIESKSTEEL